MKKIILIFLLFVSVSSVSANDIWVLDNGEYFSGNIAEVFSLAKSRCSPATFLDDERTYSHTEVYISVAVRCNNYVYKSASGSKQACPAGTFYYPAINDCQVPTDCGEGVGANQSDNQCPPIDETPQCDPPAVWNVVWSQCTIPRSCPDGTASTVQNPCVPDNNCPNQSDQAPAGSIAISGESKCANGCVAQYTRNNDGSGTGSYLYSGGSCNDLGDGCHEEEGAALVCGFNPENDPAEDPKPNPNEGEDPLEEEHPDSGGDGEGDATELPEGSTADCESLQHYYYDSSNPEHSPPSAAYAKCPQKVHDQNIGVNPNEPIDCLDLPIWDYSSSNPYTLKPPPEYDDCPSRINDTSPFKKETDDLCKAGEICDTTFSSGQDNICDKAPICIEDDNFKCVTLRMQWEFMCLFDLEEEDKNHTGDERKLDSTDANYFKSIEQGGASETVDVSDTFLGAGDGWGWSRVCPAPPSFTFNGQTFDLDNYYFCLFLEYAGNLMVLFSLLGAGRMMFS